MKKIEYINGGNTYSRIIAGCMRWGVWGAKFDLSQYVNMMSQSVDYGISTFDHADIYGDYTTEQEFGKAFSESGISRDSIELITKCGIKRFCSNKPEHKINSYDCSKEHIISSVDTSLSNLKTDYIDLLLIHRPSILMRAEETAEAFAQLQTQGKVLEFGVSNFTSTQFDLLHAHFPLVTNQLELSPVAMDPFEDGTIDHLQLNKIRPQAWSPMGSATMFGAHAQPEVTQRIQRFQKLCKEYDWTLAEMALLFLLHHPSQISPIVGTTKPERLLQALNTLEKSISDEQWFEIWTASKGHSVA